MSHSIVSSLIEGVVSSSDAPEEMLIANGAEGVPYVLKLKFTQLTPGLRGALESLHGDGRPLSTLTGSVLGSDGFAGLAKLRFFIKSLGEKGFLRHALLLGDTVFMRIRPVAAQFRFDEQQIAADKRYIGSRFACLRRGDAGQMIVESPTSHGVATLHHPAALAAFHHLTRPCTAADLAEASAELDEGAARAFMACLASVGAIEEADDSGETRTESDPALGQWSFHDLAFHTRSRMGRHDNPYGATYRNAKRFGSLPITKPAMSDERISLYKPDLDQLMREDAPFSAVQDRRQSVREYGESP
ncbi:MAG: hypothetical protein AAGC55_11585, partial [Myxococcota bacterium]